MKKWRFFLLFLLGFLVVGRPIVAAGISGLGTAEEYTITDGGAKSGDILVHTGKGLVRSTGAYANDIFGVITDTPLVVVRTGIAGDLAVVRSGTTKVNVNTRAGAIAVGDYVTTSGVAGQGMTAVQSGNVLGVALEGFSGPGVGQIIVSVQPQYAELTVPREANKLFELLGASFLTNVQNPEQFGTIVRYLLAALILLASLSFGFYTFSRSIPKGVEAIGRNPLARNTIYLSMVLNVALIAIVGFLGVLGSLLVIRF